MTRMVIAFIVLSQAMQAGLAWLGEPPTRAAMSLASVLGAMGWLLLMSAERGR